MHRSLAITFVFGLCAGLAACSGGNGADDAGDGPPRDSMDASDTALDVASESHDGAPDVAMDVVMSDAMPDVMIDYGMCGASVRTCICGCGMNATCQQGCVNGNMDCAGCLYDAATMCCVGESMALDTCINNYNCMDDTCITTNCMAQVNALNTCFGHRQATDPACTMLVRGCLGSDYPMVQCLMP